MVQIFWLQIENSKNTKISLEKQENFDKIDNFDLSSPHMGGSWESFVKLIKTLLPQVYGESYIRGILHCSLSNRNGSEFPT
jgi:hypothetical protein